MLREKPTGEIKIAYDHDNEPYLFEATGKEAKHFYDILRAEDDGRLLILPCKVGDDVLRRLIDEINDMIENIEGDFPLLDFNSRYMMERGMRMSLMRIKALQKESVKSEE